MALERGDHFSTGLYNRKVFKVRDIHFINNLLQMVKQNKNDEEKHLFEIFEHPMIPTFVDEVLTREVKSVGNSARVNIPRKHIGKKCRVVIYNKNFKLEEQKEES